VDVPVNALHHVGYWVEDLDRAVERAVATLGVGPFLVHRQIRFDAFELADGTAIKDPDYLDHSAAFAAWGPVTLELAQVHRIDAKLAESYGFPRSGVGHVSWVVADLEAESARLAGLGCPLIHTAASGEVRVAWHDGGALFPHPIEVHKAGGPILGMHSRLAGLADGWDGTHSQRSIATGEPL
jgi:catechol 2,3-dioxygenase-like lactoylglutathione lyase family enzyme